MMTHFLPNVVRPLKKKGLYQNQWDVRNLTHRPMSQAYDSSEFDIYLWYLKTGFGPV